MSGQRVRVFFSPVACPKANIDREKSAWRAASEGLDIAEAAESADIAVVFACGFIDDAKQEAIDDILAYAAMRRQGKLKGLVVAGCLPEKYGEELARRITEVDCFVGASEIERLSQAITGLAGGGSAERIERRADRGGNWDAARSGLARQPERVPCLARPWTRAVMICDGCDNACTYCAIPEMRGPLRSRPPEEVVREAKMLVEQGAREIVIAGQDTASYGRDSGGPALGQLIGRLALESGARWIRLAYANPENLDAQVASSIRNHSNVCHYLDMPIQHASPAVLAAMGRRKGPNEIRRLVEQLRMAVPDIALRTSVIVGFPGESEKDFQALISFLRSVEFDMVGVFKFSPQPGTAATRLSDRVPNRIAEDRLVEVTSLAHEIAREKTEKLVGRTLEVLVEGKGKVRGTGRSGYDMAEVDRVIELKKCVAEPGQFVNARIVRTIGAYELEGTCLNH